MSAPLSLTPTSFIVLGLIERSGTATPYELKRMVAASIGNFWSVPHSQLYSEPDRLTDAGYLQRTRERGGLRRKRYSLTEKGQAALEDWRRAPTAALPELRDEALLKLFFDSDQRLLAREQLEAHRAKLEIYEQLSATDTGAKPRGPWLALRAGIGHEREWVQFWSALAET
jgi:DNA-binding PadR family transcriptional regulator